MRVQSFLLLRPDAAVASENAGPRLFAAAGSSARLCVCGALPALGARSVLHLPTEDPVWHDGHIGEPQ